MGERGHNATEVAVNVAAAQEAQRPDAVATDEVSCVEGEAGEHWGWSWWDARARRCRSCFSYTEGTGAKNSIGRPPLPCPGGTTGTCAAAAASATDEDGANAQSTHCAAAAAVYDGAYSVGASAASSPCPNNTFFVVALVEDNDRWKARHYCTGTINIDVEQRIWHRVCYKHHQVLGFDPGSDLSVRFEADRANAHMGCPKRGAYTKGETDYFSLPQESRTVRADARLEIKEFGECWTSSGDDEVAFEGSLAYPLLKQNNASMGHADVSVFCYSLLGRAGDQAHGEHTLRFWSKTRRAPFHNATVAIKIRNTTVYKLPSSEEHPLYQGTQLVLAAPYLQGGHYTYQLMGALRGEAMAMSKLCPSEGCVSHVCDAAQEKCWINLNRSSALEQALDGAATFEVRVFASNMAQGKEYEQDVEAGRFSIRLADKFRLNGANASYPVAVDIDGYVNEFSNWTVVATESLDYANAARAVTYTVVDGPDWLLINPKSGRIQGMPDKVAQRQSLTMLAQDGTHDIRVARITMRVMRRPDCWNNATKAVETCSGHGSCQDDVAFDGMFVCVCAAEPTGAQYFGTFCQNSATTSSSGGSAPGTVVTIVIVCLVVLVLWLLVGVAWTRYQAFRIRICALDFVDEIMRLHERGTIACDKNNMKIPRELPRRSVKLLDVLGSGAFGEVRKGLHEQSKTLSFMCAVKTCTTANSMEQELITEAALMAQFEHENVCGMIGVVTVGEPMLLVMQLYEFGSLKSYISKEAGFVALNLHTKIELIRQVACGMAYLAGYRFVHRDLAARNVMVASDHTCAVGDFGMSRQLEDNGAEYYRMQTMGMIPCRWTAVEALTQRRYSPASDMWAFGVLCWEIFADCEMPYCDLSNEQVIMAVQSGQRLLRPLQCPPIMYNDIMLRCWTPEPSERIKFRDVALRLKFLLSSTDIAVPGPTDGLLRRSASVAGTSRPPEASLQSQDVRKTSTAPSRSNTKWMDTYTTGTVDVAGEVLSTTTSALPSPSMLPPGVAPGPGSGPGRSAAVPCWPSLDLGGLGGGSERLSAGAHNTDGMPPWPSLGLPASVPGAPGTEAEAATPWPALLVTNTAASGAAPTTRRGSYRDISADDVPAWPSLHITSRPSSQLTTPGAAGQGSWRASGFSRTSNVWGARIGNLQDISRPELTTDAEGVARVGTITRENPLFHATRPAGNSVSTAPGDYVTALEAAHRTSAPGDSRAQVEESVAGHPGGAATYSPTASAAGGAYVQM